MEDKIKDNEKKSFIDFQRLTKVGKEILDQLSPHLNPTLSLKFYAST